MIIRSSIVGIALSLLVLEAASAAEEETDTVYQDPRRACEQLTDVIRTIADGHIQGDFSARLEVALAAFDRISCNPRRLLEVLQIYPD